MDNTNFKNWLTECMILNYKAEEGRKKILKQIEEKKTDPEYDKACDTIDKYMREKKREAFLDKNK